MNLIRTGLTNCSCERSLFACPKEVSIYTFYKFYVKDSHINIILHCLPNQTF